MVKDKIKAPIDLPLSRAYLREFAGWSTAFPPGVSDPSSLRIMENVLIGREGGAQVRPGLRYMSYDTLPDEDTSTLGTGLGLVPVGTHEAFFLNDGSKAYLMAVRENDDTVGFRVIASDDTVLGLTDAAVGFEIPQGETALAFTAATTYVKYLQIDNNIFALSNAGESMRQFKVGEEKTARRLLSIERPAWNVDDKLTVVHPDAAWINNGDPVAVRTNMLSAQSMDNIDAVAGYSSATAYEKSSEQANNGTYSVKLWAKPVEVNLHTKPLSDLNTTGLTGWNGYGDTDSLTVDAVTNSMHVTIDGSSGTTRTARIQGPRFSGIKAGYWYRISLYLEDAGANVDRVGWIARWYDSSDSQIGSDVTRWFSSTTSERKSLSQIEAPSGAVKMRVLIQGETDSGGTPYFKVKDLRVAEGNGSAMLTGDDGAYYFWTGTAHESSSLYQPPQDIGISETLLDIDESTNYIYSSYVRPGSTVRNAHIEYTWFDDIFDPTTDADTSSAETAATFVRYSYASSSPAGTLLARAATVIEDVEYGEVHYVDSCLMETGAVLGSYFDGDTADLATFKHEWLGDQDASPSTATEVALGVTVPAAETATANTLISSTSDDNIYSFGFFYTFVNEVGETAPSQVTIVRAQRPWAGWKWEGANASGEPDGTVTADPILCADQLVAYMPQAVFDAAQAKGATGWRLYFFTWSNQETVPVTATLVDERELASDSLYGSSGWLRVTPQLTSIGSVLAVLPTKQNRFNSTDPSHGGQGLVASDRMVVVFDPTAAAVVKWTSNEQGSYTDFSSGAGGGYKTLTSGNLFVPAAVKLWQNPSSVDTITILCMGVDGHSTAYYMAPSQVAQQSEAVNVMGFEETTATPGTTSPYGCEVLNNALYHPLDAELMKSTASNYNINHKSQTDQVRNMWGRLLNKHRIVSSMLDNRLYYLVHNPDGESLEDGCNGNEIWVLDVAAKTGHWSRLLIQAVSLRKIAHGDGVYMSVVKPDGVYFLDELYPVDDVVDGSGDVVTQAIPWKLETNTQGANRAHDAWANLQQVNPTFGNFQGRIRYGIRGWDVYGQAVDVFKDVRDDEEPGDLAYDRDDYLQVRRSLKEWFFYAESVEDAGVVQPSSGQISMVQYRYSPISVNVGYEYGSVETFEYGRDSSFTADVDTYTDSGVPQPYLDVRRP